MKYINIVPLMLFALTLMTLLAAVIFFLAKLARTDMEIAIIFIIAICFLAFAFKKWAEQGFALYPR